MDKIHVPVAFLAARLAKVQVHVILAFLIQIVKMKLIFAFAMMVGSEINLQIQPA
jgi:hypothetical protein